MSCPVTAGVIIAFTNWNWLDPLVSVLIGAFILWNAWGILRQSIHILLESAPENIDMKSMVDTILKIDGVQGVHDLHVWSINEGLQLLSAHIVTGNISMSAGSLIQQNINELLSHQYNIQHATLQLECTGCQPSLLFCDISETSHEHI
jgi:cobalt-zinc-cadmium efflux system protein